MTTVVIEKSPSGAYKGFTCMGHAGYAKDGDPDILCSAISALSIHTINGLEKAAGQKLDVKTDQSTGFMRVQILDDPGVGANALMDSFVYSMQDLSEEYGQKFLQIQFKEVKDNA